MTKMEFIINPFARQSQQIEISDSLARMYSLDDWAAQFSLMTAGYRDRLDPDDASNPGVPFNLVTVAILGEAKARVFGRKQAPGAVSHVHVGGETRPHTQEFIALLSRIYAAHGFIVHLRAEINTTPIWYSSFGVFYNEYQHGENMTASHSPYFKGGWKPMDSEGKQLLAEEAELTQEVRNIVKERATISLAAWESANIKQDFDIDTAYVSYQKSVLGEELIAGIKAAGRRGFRCAICPQGGSMKASSDRLFQGLGISTGEGGIVQYFYGEEDSRYHQLGVVDGQDFGADPGKRQIYRNIGAQQMLARNQASVIFIWDPDGDRLNIVTKAPSGVTERALELGLEVEPLDIDSSIVYFTPNQIFFMLTAFRIATLRANNLLHAFDWFVACSMATTRSIQELAGREGFPVPKVRVGFKYLGTLSDWLERRTDPEEAYVTPAGERVLFGSQPRALIMCEESGGAVFGGVKLLKNRSGNRGLLALREKDGMQFGLFTMALAAWLYEQKLSFAEYYCDLIEKSQIKYKYFSREDVLLYDESLSGAERQRAKAEGISKRDRTMIFLESLVAEFTPDNGADTVLAKLKAAGPGEGFEFPRPKLLCSLGDGVFVEFESAWAIVRASGTDAVLRYYVEGTEKGLVTGLLESFMNLRV